MGCFEGVAEGDVEDVAEAEVDKLAEAEGLADALLS